MKTRVIKYDRSGTKVVNAFLELEPVDENVFKAFYKSGGIWRAVARHIYYSVPYQ